MLAVTKKAPPEFTPRQDSRSDEELVLAFRGGDTPAFTTLVKRYERALTGYLIRELHGDCHRAADVLQETLIKLAEWAASDAEIRSPGLNGFIHTLATRKLIDILRKEARHPSVNFSATPGLDEDAPGYDVPDVRAPSPLDTVGGIELKNLETSTVQEALDRAFPQDSAQRKAILLRLAGCSDKEIASELGTCESTVRSNARNGIRNFGDAIREEPRLLELAELIAGTDLSTFDSAA